MTKIRISTTAGDLLFYVSDPKHHVGEIVANELSDEAYVKLLHALSRGVSLDNRMFARPEHGRRLEELMSFFRGLGLNPTTRVVAGPELPPLEDLTPIGAVN